MILFLVPAAFADPACTVIEDGGTVSFADVVTRCVDTNADPNDEDVFALLDGATPAAAICSHVGSLQMSAGACITKRLFADVIQARSLKWDGGMVTITGTPDREPQGEPLSLSGDSLTLPSSPGKGTLLFYSPKRGWSAADATGPVLGLGPDSVALLTEENALVSIGTKTFTVEVEEAPVALPAMDCSLDDTERSGLVVARRSQLVCIDRSGASPDLQLSPALGGWLPVNRSIVVKVRVPSADADETKVTLDGTPGLTLSKVETPDTSVKAASREGSEKQAPKFVIRTFVFAPRQPGVATLTLDTRGASSAVAQFTFAQPVGGAVRVGVGLSTVVDASYSAVMAPGSSTAEIMGTTVGAVQPELVIGWAPFLEKEGRVYANPNHVKFAPYLGLGVVAVNPENETALSLLRSVYAGVEWEFMHSSSLTLAGTVRRVSRLADSFDVGGPIGAATAVPTTTGYMPGLAIIFNVSPEFLEYGRTAFRTKSQ